MRHLMILAFVAACGPPVARNIPAPNKAAAAGVAAGAAAALTLADPKAAAANVEANKVPDEKKPQTVKTTVPADVFDRLDAQKARAPMPPSQQPSEPQPEPEN